MYKRLEEKKKKKENKNIEDLTIERKIKDIEIIDTNWFAEELVFSIDKFIIFATSAKDVENTIKINNPKTFYSIEDYNIFIY